MKESSNNKQPKNRKRTFKISVFGIMRTALLMGSLLFFLKDFIILGGVGLVFYLIVLYFEKRYKEQNKA